MHTLESLRQGQLAGATRLDLAADLTEVPDDVLGLADTLEVLNLSHNRLTALPAWLPRLKRLKVLFASYNQFETLPEVLGDCATLSQVGLRNNRIHTVPAAALPPALRWLTLTDNALRHLPPELGDCQSLEKLMLSGNRLQQLPPTLAGLPQLALLRLAANQFSQWPGWVMELPALAWLAVAGNPWPDAAGPTQPAARRVPWSELQVGAELGRGASGTTWAARWHSPDLAHDLGQAAPEHGAMDAAMNVAVKVFGAAVTSDGTPESELAACLSPGPHPGLTSALGQVEDHPAGAQALVMPLLPARLQALAGPPSLASCSRDVYAPQAQWPAATVAALLQQAVAALAHLHQHGVLHGDVYAHNLLWAPADAQGPTQAVLSDFGAALRWPSGLAAHWPAAQRLEVRAVGHLLDELLSRCTPSADATALQAAWGPWRDACLQPQVKQRPLVTELLAELLAALRAHR